MKQEWAFVSIGNSWCAVIMSAIEEGEWTVCDRNELD